MFHGQHTLEEICWHEGIDRATLNDTLAHYDQYVACVVAPAEELDDREAAASEEDAGPPPR